MIDDLRARYPALGFALYAYEPGGAVTLEVMDGSDVYSFKGATMTEAVALAFPPEPADIENPISDPEPETPAPAASVFD